MAVIRWNFPNGANGDTLTAPLAGADTLNFSGGAATLSNAYALSGVNTLSARFPLEFTGHLWVAKEGLSATAIAYDVYVYVPALLGGTVHIAWSGLGSSGRALSVLFGGSQNVVQLHDSTGMVWSNPVETPFPLNTWVRISVYGTCGAGTGTGRLAWYLGHDTTPQQDSGLLTNLSTQTSIDRIRIGGKAASSSVVGGVIHFGSWAYDTGATGLLEPIRTWTTIAPQRHDGSGWSPLTMRKREGGAWQPNNTSFK